MFGIIVHPLSASLAYLAFLPVISNEFLSALQLSSDEAVKRVLAGEKVDLKSKASTSRSQGKENREGRERQLDKEVSPLLTKIL